MRHHLPEVGVAGIAEEAAGQEALGLLRRQPLAGSQLGVLGALQQANVVSGGCSCGRWACAAAFMFIMLNSCTGSSMSTTTAAAPCLSTLPCPHLEGPLLLVRHRLKRDEEGAEAGRRQVNLIQGGVCVLQGRSGAQLCSSTAA